MISQYSAATFPVEPGIFFRLASEPHISIGRKIVDVGTTRDQSRRLEDEATTPKRRIPSCDPVNFDSAQKELRTLQGRHDGGEATSKTW